MSNQHKKVSAHQDGAGLLSSPAPGSKRPNGSTDDGGGQRPRLNLHSGATEGSPEEAGGAGRQALPRSEELLRQVLSAQEAERQNGEAARRELEEKVRTQRLAAVEAAAAAAKASAERDAQAKEAEAYKARAAASLRTSLSAMPHFSIYSTNQTQALAKTDPVYQHLESELLRTATTHAYALAERTAAHLGPLQGEAPQFVVSRIERMFNPRLQANYLAKTQDIAGKVGKRVSDTLDGIDAIRVESFAGLQLNEFLLYHGTPSKIAPLLQKQGLDPQRAGVHRGKMFGYGAYMATNSSKSDLYTEPTTLSADPRKKGERCILVVRACLGEPFRAARTNTQLRLPPDRPAAWEDLG